MPTTTETRSSAPSTPVVENKTTVCFCGKEGVYLGCQPAGAPGGPLRVGFKCSCGAHWGFLVPKGDVEKYRS